MLGVYAKFCEDALAIPVVKGRKTDSDKFGVWYLHKKCSAVGYRKEMERISRTVNETLTFDSWFESEMGIVPSDYNKRKLSKLSMDIWRQLEGMRTVNAI